MRKLAKKNLVAGLVFALFVFVLISCASPTSSSTQPPQAIYTAAAQTMLAQMTLEAGATAVAQLTEIARGREASPSAPPPPAPSAAPPVETVPPPAPTQLPPTATASPAPCNLAELVSQAPAIPDLAFTPRAAFIYTWRFKNIGSCTWTPGYALVFIGGSYLGSSSAIPLAREVPPGDVVDLATSMTAPDLPGDYTANWILRTTSGEFFGVLPNPQSTIDVYIHVISLASSGTTVYDLAPNYCSARWSSATGALLCPGASNDPNGSVDLLTQARLESGSTSQLTLWARPNDSPDGWIQGIFPAYRVQVGDHFQTGIGCLWDSPACSLRFQLLAEDQFGSQTSLGAWREVYDGLSNDLDVDLTPLVGSSVRFILQVTNSGSSVDANGFWLDPHILNLSSSGTEILTWVQESSDGSTCNELQIYQTPTRTLQAEAFDCRSGSRSLGVTALGEDDLNRVLGWERALGSFDADVYQPATQQIVASINFKGRGNANAFDTQIRAIDSLARRLFSRISS